MSERDYAEHHSYDNDHLSAERATPAQVNAARLAYIARHSGDTDYAARVNPDGSLKGR